MTVTMSTRDLSSWAKSMTLFSVYYPASRPFDRGKQPGPNR
jgi:hypothetical protein